MSEAELSDDEARHLLKLRLEKSSRRVAMGAFLRGEPSSPQGADNNGTISFIKLPGGKFMVTNHHVWDTFQIERANDSSYKLSLAGKGLIQPLDISDAELVSEDRDLDICVLAYPSERIEAIGKEYCELHDWLPSRAESGDDISVTGYPGMRRSAEEMFHPQLNRVVPVLRHESVILYLHAEAISARQARLRFTNPNPEVIQLSERPINNFRWGGMSGSLVYRLDANRSLFVPCGILHAAGEGLDAIFYCTHLEYIQADGTISFSK